MLKCDYHNPNNMLNKMENMEAKSSWFSKLCYFWFTGFEKIAKHKTTSELEKLVWDLRGPNTAEVVYGNFREHFDTTPALWKALLKTFRATLWYTGVLKIFQTIAVCACPTLLRLLINFASSDEDVWMGIAYVAVLILLSLAITLLASEQIHRTTVVGYRIQSCMMNTIYRKVLSSASSDVGAINNLITTDLQCFPVVSPMLHLIWSGPLTIIITLVLLYLELGNAIWPGVALMVIIIVLFNYAINKKVIAIDYKQKKDKDIRLSFIGEILNAIKVIKLNLWEKYFLLRVNEHRSKEMKTLRYLEMYNSIRLLLAVLAPFAGCLAMFATYVYMDETNVLTVDKAFVSLTLFNTMQYPFTMIAVLKSTLNNTWTSLTRIEAFLGKVDCADIEYKEDDEDAKSALVLQNASFARETTGKHGIFKDVSFSIPKGSLVAIVGSTGCGKTTFLSALAGSILQLCGSVERYGKLAYVSQQPWLFQASLEDNILFGCAHNPKKYENALEACALDEDIKTLPHADQTAICEDGVNLSGGQKQRICIARAIYSDASIVLMDDPLSALDTHVAKQVFKNVISNDGILSGKTRIICVSNLTFLPAVDYVISIGGQNAREVKFQAKEEFKEDSFDKIERFHSERITYVDSGVIQMPKVGAKAQQEKKQTVTSPLLGRIKTTKKTKTSACDHLSIYHHYIKEIGYFVFTIGIVFQIIGQLAAVYSTVKLSEWAASRTNDTNIINNFLWIDYGLFGFLQIVFFFISCIIISFGCLCAAQTIHRKFVSHVMQLPYKFFRDNSSGHVMQRFSQDINSIDVFLPPAMREFLHTTVILGAILIFLVCKSIYFLPPAVVILVLFGYYMKSSKVISRKLRKIENYTKGPICSLFMDSIVGRTIIRVAGVENTFLKNLEGKIDGHLKYSFMYMVSQRWLSVRLEFLGIFVILVMSLLLVLCRASAANVALCLNFCFRVIQHLNQMNRSMNVIEGNIAAVDRIEEYLTIPTQKSGVLRPTMGLIEYQNVNVQFEEGESYVLRNISCTIKPGTKIGVVGRTGSGKSTLLSVLLRLVDLKSGAIFIDGHDITSIDISFLRQRIAMVQQDTILLTGSVRTNLDPMDCYSDEAIWSVLEAVNMKFYIQSVGGINGKITNKGEQFSVGQKQLLNLARALLRNPTILILDEISSNLDFEMEKLIQNHLAEYFRETTILTITHRLPFIKNCDKVMVLDAGQIVEFESVTNLLKDNESHFYRMLNAGGYLES